VLVINFTNDSIEWGTGTVNIGETNSTLDSSKAGTPGSKCLRGNWSGCNGTGTKAGGLLLRNIGNINATVALKMGKNATSFIGGTAGGGPLYRINVSNNATNVACYNTTGFTFNQWYDVNNSFTNPPDLDGYIICKQFRYETSNDTVRIDVRLAVPSDSYTGYLTDQITATAQSAIF
jgi:hypothetical protein